MRTAIILTIAFIVWAVLVTIALAQATVTIGATVTIITEETAAIVLPCDPEDEDCESCYIDGVPCDEILAVEE